MEKLVKQYDMEGYKVEETVKIDVDKEFVNENYGKLNEKTSGGAEIIDISGVDDALEQLNFAEYDKHPEKRMRAVLIFFNLITIENLKNFINRKL
jgi:hypothetical protein